MGTGIRTLWGGVPGFTPRRALWVDGSRLREWLMLHRFIPSLIVDPAFTTRTDQLRADGHDVVVVDRHDERVFDDYDTASEFAESIGY